MKDVDEMDRSALVAEIHRLRVDLARLHGAAEAVYEDVVGIDADALQSLGMALGRVPDPGATLLPEGPRNSDGASRGSSTLPAPQKPE